MENIMDITDDHLKELKVSIGHRIIFKNKVKFYKEKRDTEGKDLEKQDLERLEKKEEEQIILKKKRSSVNVVS